MPDGYTAPDIWSMGAEGAAPTLGGAHRHYQNGIYGKSP
jgi:hypothetical protein